jgi:hypothetical protein
MVPASEFSRHISSFQHGVFVLSTWSPTTPLLPDFRCSLSTDAFSIISTIGICLFTYMDYFKPEHAVAAMEEARASRNLYNFSYQKRAHLIFQRITIHNQQNSPLLRLPSELRNKIYN